MKKIGLLILIFVMIGCSSKVDSQKENEKIVKKESEIVTNSNDIIFLHPLDVLKQHSDSYKVIKQSGRVLIDFHFETTEQYNKLKQKAQLLESYPIHVELKKDGDSNSSLIDGVKNELMYEKSTGKFVLKNKINVPVIEDIFTNQEVILSIGFFDEKNIEIHRNTVHLQILEQ